MVVSFLIGCIVMRKKNSARVVISTTSDGHGFFVKYKIPTSVFFCETLSESSSAMFTWIHVTIKVMM